MTDCGFINCYEFIQARRTVLSTDNHVTSSVYTHSHRHTFGWLLIHVIHLSVIQDCVGGQLVQKKSHTVCTTKSLIYIKLRQPTRTPANDHSLFGQKALLSLISPSRKTKHNVLTTSWFKGISCIYRENKWDLHISSVKNDKSLTH